MFVGRERQLSTLANLLREVRDSGQGRLVALHGRRQVGKTRLVEEFLRRSKVPHLFFTASKQRLERELELFAEELVHSTHPAGGLLREGLSLGSWEAAFSVLGTDAVTVVVLDEFPYLLEDDPRLLGSVQKVWDRRLERKPILLLLVGSDLAMMEAISTYGSALYGRAREVVLEPFTPSEIADMLDLGPAQALDAYLVIGGFPRLAQAWGSGRTMRRFLTAALADPSSPFVVHGERILSAEFPVGDQARTALIVIGSGETTFTNVQRAAGLPETSLRRALDVLEQKRVLAVERPLSARPSSLTRYVVADPYLRFWLRFIEPNRDLIDRDRPELAIERIEGSWSAYRGKAVEPLVRTGIARLLPDPRFGSARHVGSYWTRTHDVEVDLVGAAGEHPKRLDFVGSIKWRERERFSDRDLHALLEQRVRIPGTDERTTLVGVSRAGWGTTKLDVTLEPADLLEAWRN